MRSWKEKILNKNVKKNFTNFTHKACLMTIVLTVQSTSNNFRLGFNTFDSITFFHHRELISLKLDPSVKIKCRCSCGISKKKAFDLNSKILSEWIIKNNFHIYPSRKPTKLFFSMTIVNGDKQLTFKSIKST
jgi:hypothetical protein